MLGARAALPGSRSDFAGNAGQLAVIRRKLRAFPPKRRDAMANAPRKRSPMAPPAGPRSTIGGG